MNDPNIRRIRGFRPMNGYAWDYFGWRRRLVMLFLHARFIPRRAQDVIATYRVNRTPGPRHRYPWERS